MGRVRVQLKYPRVTPDNPYPWLVEANPKINWREQKFSWWCKVCADEPRVVGSGWIDGSGRGGIGMVYQGLALAHKSHTPIIGSEIRSLG